MNRLIFQARLANEFRAAMLASKLETAGFVLAQPVRLPSGIRFLAERTFLAPPEAYQERSGDHIVLRPEYLAQVYKVARTTKRSVFTAHTHPWHGPVHPSRVDIAGEQASLPTLFRLVPNLPHGRLIFGRTETHCALYGPDEEVRVWTAGSCLSELSAPDALDDDIRYQRQMLAFGAAGQQKLRRVRVVIVGLGGTGSQVAQNLAYLGVKEFELVDPDQVDTTNLNRLVGALPTDVGLPKVVVTRRMIKAINPETVVEARSQSVLLNSVARSLSDADAIFCCTDSHGSRAVLTQLAYQYLVPVFDLGIVIEGADGRVKDVYGRVQMLSPGLPCLVCAHVLDPARVRRDLMNEFERQRDPYIIGGHVPQPAVVTLNATVAALASTMFLAALTELPFHARYELYRARSGTVRAVQATAEPDCVVCSNAGALGRGDSWPLPGRLSE